MAQYVKLGPKASFFRASSIDVSIAPCEVVSLNAKQMNHRLIKRALNGGHLVFTEKQASAELTDEQLKESFEEMVAAGETPKKISKNFSLKELNRIASLYEIEIEDGDTKEEICVAIMEEASQSK